MVSLTMTLTHKQGTSRSHSLGQAPNPRLIQWDSSCPHAWVLWLLAMISSKLYHFVPQHRHLSHRKQ